MYDPKATISSVNVSISNVLKKYISSKGMIEFKLSYYSLTKRQHIEYKLYIEITIQKLMLVEKNTYKKKFVENCGNDN